MAQGKFIIPGNITLSQALQLLFSMVNVQFKNVSTDLERIILQPHADRSALKHVERTLSEILDYLSDGIKRIKSQYRMEHLFSRPPAENKHEVDDLRILEQDVKRAKEVAMERLGQSESMGSSEHAHTRFSAFLKSRLVSSRKEALKKAQEEIEAMEVEDLRRQRQLEDERQKYLKDERRRKMELERNKRIEESIKKELEAEAAERLPSIKQGAKESSRTSTEIKKSHRLSLDVSMRRPILRSSEMPRQRYSMYETKNTDAISVVAGVNKAAMLAWFKDKEPPSNNNNLTPTRSVPERPINHRKYEYKRPEARRNPIKSSSRSTSYHRTKGADEESPAQIVVTDTSLDAPSRRPEPVRSPTGRRSTARKGSPLRRHSPSPLQSSTIIQSPESSMDKRIEKVMADLKGVDTNSCEQILNDILVVDDNVRWDDVAGLANAKSCLKETVVYPFLRPDLFRGLREPISGMLLFGPPGTGKTMIARAVATESNSTFFSISASSLLSKYLGESEKLVRALFYLANKLSPSIIFIDEIDSLLTARSDNENESSRRIKTELFIQWSNLTSGATKENTEFQQAKRVLVLAATNLPWAIDEAAIRRFSRRLYIPLPEYETRLYHLKKLMSLQKNDLSEEDFNIIANNTEGYSGSDITALAKEAAMEPIRELGDNLINATFNTIRGVVVADFNHAMSTIKKSVSPESLHKFVIWAANFGSVGS
ncbi:putative AAA family ATPase YTA6 Ecym_7036 [Eremothecium cymbalariae DBVPG|uniref:AAA+ ATPase domain-containing protein n=1 Tax=Eremothecium cymbalariae (strain CBS 270.75 / DBVPG 7215 / KCTC 17166 / NRRL Y-17582) TaxID=931890 RepID=G8JVM7_ERECY|nr:hypothetical protein Ecym_7036 [Eremothecium cymbalariae DBVPG\